MAAKLSFVALLGSLAWMCAGSAADRAGWSLPSSWWGTSVPRIAVDMALIRGDTPGAIAAAKTVVRRDPAGRSSASILAEALQAAGQARRSALAFQIALTNGWRDTESQVWGLEAALANQDPHQAAAHLDAISRIAPGAAQQSSLFTAIEKSRAGKIALAERLSYTPRWASGWLQSSAELHEGQVNGRIETLQMARGGGLVVTASDAAAASWGMIDTHPKHALAFWNAIKGPGDSSTRGIWDADFARSSPNLGRGPFEWRRNDSTGVQIKPADPLHGSGLEISNLSIATSTLMETLTSLGPGTWRLSWQQTGTPGVHIVPSCAEPASSTDPALLPSSIGKAVRFSVTASCPIQKISIVTTGDAAPSSRGTIFGVSVNPESPSLLVTEARDRRGGDPR